VQLAAAQLTITTSMDFEAGHKKVFLPGLLRILPGVLQKTKVH
jgi:hypothetical protein